MAITDADIAFAREVFRNLPALTTRKMFGGLSLYSEGKVFAIVGPENRIYIKAKGALADDLAAEGSEKFTFESATKSATMGYWTLPDAALDDPEEAEHWAKRALAEA
ncbi:MAG: TfoX/Sxy family protein [Pseudomonadota bacterium]